MTHNVLLPALTAVSYIRWSSDRQSDGSTLARQRRIISRMCSELGWPTEREIRDEGVSGFFGDNLDDGNLGEFIRQCEREGGQGQALVTEMISRISRLNAWDAMMNIGRMINTGLTVVLADKGMVIDSHTIRTQAAQLKLIVEEAEKAHREVDDRVRIILEAWQIMRDEGRPVHCRSTCPAWLEMDQGRTRFLNLDLMSSTATRRVALLNEIFDLYISGIGFSRIARILNERGEPTFRQGDGWRQSSVKALIHNRAVIGEYQHRVGGRPIGDPIPNYFPAAISNEKFALANEPAHRRVMTSHADKKLTNLLSDIARCAECGGRMLFRNKSRACAGVPSTYLQCDNYARGRGCGSRRMVRYEPAERAILDMMLERALDDQHFQVGDDIADIRRRMADEQRKLADASRSLENILDSLVTFNERPALKRDFEIRAMTAETDVDTARQRVDSLKDELARASGKASRAEHIRRVSDIRDDLKSADRAKAAQAARLIKMSLNDIIDTVKFDVHRQRIEIALIHRLGFATGPVTGPIAFLDLVKGSREQTYRAAASDERAAKAVGGYLDRRARLAS